MSHRGKKRSVVEVLNRERVNPSGRPRAGYYVSTVRLACGHVTKACAHNRFRKDETPSIAYCAHPECVMADGVAA